ncbi:MAG: hypothetical protein HY473_02050 [Candidatus Sungbacteria bacterium]|uniref:DUF5673 domain-containing protein n=1 Tax=Candidatus Sungiibacteriota bacterium TaxID=2750080 RepID=A0A932YXU2_9BACT|nr:hypothetical protein [Candidatus Sungbacteria bacterium]
MRNRVIDLRKPKQELEGETIPKISEKPAAPVAAPPEKKTAESAVSEPENSPSSILLAWEAPEFEQSASGALVLLLVGTLLVVGSAGALFFKNFLFALLLSIAGGLVISYAYRTPHQIRFRVTARGIGIGGKLYEFETLSSFWIFYEPPLAKELSLVSKKMFAPAVRAPLGDLDPLRLREILLRFLKEEKHEESLVDILAKRLGF